MLNLKYCCLCFYKTWCLKLSVWCQFWVELILKKSLFTEMVAIAALEKSIGMLKSKTMDHSGSHT